jgi:hypothetical protein
VVTGRDSADSAEGWVTLKIKIKNKEIYDE